MHEFIKAWIAAAVELAGQHQADAQAMFRVGVRIGRANHAAERMSGYMNLVVAEPLT